MSEHDMTPLPAELRELVDADHECDVASSTERAAIRRRLLISIGVAGAGGLGGAGGAAAATGGGAGAAGAAGLGGASSAGAIATGITAGKFITTTVVVAALAGGTTVAVHELREPPRRAAVAHVSAERPSTGGRDTMPDPIGPARVAPTFEVTPSAFPPADVLPPDIVEPIGAPTTPRAPRTTVRATSAPPAIASPAHVPTPSEERTAEPGSEAALIGALSRALAAGDATGALELVADHERLYASGALVEERDALRIDALLAAGRTRDAHERASRFRARYPGSLHTARLDRALASRKVTP